MSSRSIPAALASSPASAERAARIHHGVGHTTHQVFAEADLRIHDAGGRNQFAGPEIAQMRRDRRGTDVDRHAEGLVTESRPHGDDLLAVVHRDGRLPLALAERRLQVAEHREVAGEARELPFTLERLHQPAQVAGRILHVGLAHFDVVQADDRVELDLARIGILAHDLAMHLAFGWNVDHDVRLHARGTGQPAP